MDCGCENKVSMVRRLNMSKARVVPLVPPLLPSLVNNKKQRLSDHRCVIKRLYNGCHVHFQGGGGPGGQRQCAQDALTG